MTSQERILAVLNRQIPDKVPLCPRLDPKWLQNAGPALSGQIIRTLDVALYVDLLPDVALFLGQEAADRFSAETRGVLRYETLDTPKASSSCTAGRSPLISIEPCSKSRKTHSTPACARTRRTGTSVGPVNPTPKTA